jgi:hypothetical protein
MTEELTTALRAEASGIRVPGAPAYDILSAGRRLRRRRRGSVSAAAAGVLVAGIVGVTAFHPKPDTGFHPADAGELSGTEPTYYGNIVRLDDHAAATLDEPVVALLYSSAGALALTSPNDTGHYGAPYHLTEVTADGAVRPLGVTLQQVWISAEPDQPYVAWAEPSGTGVEVVVRDVTSNQDVGRVAVSGRYPMPPKSYAVYVSLDGDTVYVAAQGGGYAVDWRTGEVTEVPTIRADGAMEVHGGRVVDLGSHTVKDVTSGRVVLDYGRAPDADLSPDGRYLQVPGRDNGVMHVDDVSTGSRVRLTTTFGQWGWTPEGRPFAYANSTGHDYVLATCDPETGRCDRTPYPYLGRYGKVHPEGFLESIGANR